MSARFERSVQDWYDHSRTANLAYLDLANQSKPKLTDLAHNIAVVYDRLSLHSKVSIKNYYTLLDKVNSVQNNLETFQFEVLKEIKALRKQLEVQRPLTKKEVSELVTEISRQPRIEKEEALRLTTALKEKVKVVEQLILEVKERLI